MKQDVDCVSPDHTVHEAATRMRDGNIGFLPVCTENEIIGTITDRDLTIRVLAENLAATTRIGEVFSDEAVICRAEEDLQVAQNLMATNQKSRIMCVDGDGRLVGVISLSDIAKHEGAGAVKTLRAVSDREARA